MEETDKELVLVSWENVKFHFSQDLINHSEFIRHLPDFGQEIKLEMLGIDTETLKLIYKFMKINEPLPEAKTLQQGVEVFASTSQYREFFSEISQEHLSLLISAANKLDLRNLQKLCSMVIAKIIADISQQEIDSLFSIDELTIDQDDYLRFETFKWPY